MTCKTKPLTNEQLVLRHQAGDKDAIDALLQKNQGMLYKLALKFADHDSAEFDDAIQEASMMLVDCADGWEAERGVKFITYAWKSIYGFLQRWASLQTLIRIPNHHLLAGASHYTIFGSRALALNDELGRLLDRVKEPREIVSDREERRREMQRVRDRMLRIDERSRIVLRARARGENRQEIGDRLGVSRERVRQIEVAAMKKLGAAGALPRTTSSRS